jgi:glycosyltransferase involved in cell wall biosynthesis
MAVSERVAAVGDQRPMPCPATGRESRRAFRPMHTRTERRPSRILYVCYAPPVPARLGPARRHYHVLEQLARFYDVHLISLGSAADEEIFARDLGTRVRRFEFVAAKWPPGQARMRKACRTLAGRCDFIPVCEPGLRELCAQAASRDAFDAVVLSIVLLRGLPLPDNVPIVGDTHNAEFDVLRRTASLSDSFLVRRYASWQWRSTRREEARCADRVDLLLATSSRDRDVFEAELGARRVAVIPNGIDPAEFANPGAPPSPGAIVFSGLMSYYPNQQAVRWFLDEVFPLIVARFPSARFIIAGADPPAWLTARATSSVEVTGRVSDIRPYLERASVVVAPLLIGGGTRVKILQAQAMGKPVVSTSLGAEGLGLRHDDSVLLADDPKSFATCVVDLLSDSRLATRIAVHGTTHVQRHFDWHHIGETLNHVLQTQIGLTPRHQADESTTAVAEQC